MTVRPAGLTAAPQRPKCAKATRHCPEPRTASVLVSNEREALIESPNKEIPMAKKLKKAEALKIMSDYFQQNKATLPKSVTARRESIVELLIQGYTAEQAFAEPHASEK